MSDIRGGETVLIKGRVTDDGLAIVVGAGLEFNRHSVEIVAELPPDMPPRLAVGMVLFFASTEDREDFAESFRAAYDCEPVCL